jgi:hypothetical protein
MSRHRLPIIVCSAICLLILSLPASGQTASCRMEGFVKDSTGASVAGALVRAVNVRTRVVFEARTDTSGFYVFPALPPADYEIRVEAKDFRPAVNTPVPLEGPVVTLEDIVLETGTGTEPTVTESLPTQLQGRGAQMTGTVTRSDIEVLPLLTRDPLTLSAYQPGVQVAPGNIGASSVNGARPTSGAVMLDGVEASNIDMPGLGRSLLAVNTDTAEQFRVVTAGGTAQYGRVAGAQVEAVTRSGADAWHGRVYDYLQDRALNAGDFFANSTGLRAPKFNQNMYGASFAGPVQRGRTFLFGNYEGRRTNQDLIRNRIVLTPEAKSGLFRWLPPQATDTQQFDIIANDPRRLGIDPKIAPLLALLPDPNNTDLGDGLNTGGFRFNNPINSHADQFTVRADFDWSSRHRLFYRHSWERDLAVDWRNNADATFPGRPQGEQKNLAWGNSAGWEWVLSEKTINEFRFGYATAKVDFLRPDFQSGPIFYSNSFTDPLNISAPQGMHSRIFEAMDNLTSVRGNHILEAGASFRLVTQKRYTYAGSSPLVTFAPLNGNAVPSSIGPSGATLIFAADRLTFENLYNDLLGRMDEVTQTFYGDLTSFQSGGTPRSREYRFNEIAGFVQDNWKWRPNFTISAGVRYELFGVPSERSSLQAVLDKASLASPTANIDDFTLQRGGDLYKENRHNFAPRVGFAWDPRRSGKTVIRGSYGIFYDRFSGAAASLVDANTPGFSQDASLFPNLAGTDRRLSDGVPLPALPGSPALTPAATRSVSVALFNPELSSSYLHQFTLRVQRQLPLNIFLEVGYVGSRGEDLLMNQDLNQNKTEGDFLKSFLELRNFRLNLTPIPSGNTLVRIFGSGNAAITAIGGATLEQGLVGDAADTVDTQYFSRYAPAGIPEYYLRNYPQFDRFVMVSNDGRSYYDSLQVRVFRQSGSLRANGSYTWSKSLDNSSFEPSSLAAPLDSFNLALDKGLSDGQRRHVLTAALTCSPLFKSDGWLANAPSSMRKILENWDLGALAVWESGPTFSVSSGRRTTGSSADSRANYSGNPNIGSVTRASNGVYWFSLDEFNAFSAPDPGEEGTSARNMFHGPGYFDVDLALTRHFRLREKRAIVFRGEVYNVLNRTNFGLPNANLADLSQFGRITSTVGTPRKLQVALRFEF